MTAASMYTTLTSASSPAAMSSSSSSSDSSSSSVSITANDFLILLVTEMKNQDPTSDQDPNEYINQLVGVNSLQQLISINETLTDALGTSSTSTTSESKSVSSSTQAMNAMQATHASTADGNLSTPSATPSAQAVATALSGARRAS